MQPLRDYLNESPLQYEGILDPNQSKIMGRMTDDVIRQRIREYCTYDSRKYARGEQWVITHPDYKIVKIDKDNIGWYIETRSAVNVGVIYGTLEKSFYDFLLSHRCKIDAQKGFLIEDLDIYFRWRKHNGLLEIGDSPNLESTQGLPEELEQLHLYKCCQKSKKIDVCNKINVISIWNIDDLKIFGNGCKNVIINPNFPNGNITAPNGVKIHHPKGSNEYIDLSNKLSKR